MPALAANSVGGGGRWASAATREVGTVIRMSRNADDIVKRLTGLAEGKFDSMSLDLLRDAAREIERLRVDNERLLQVVRRLLPNRPGVLGGIGDGSVVDDITHPVLLGEIVEIDTTFVDVKGEALSSNPAGEGGSR